MIELVTLFLSLVAGPVEIDLAVDPAVSSVVLELDGERVAELSEPPWTTTLDLGDSWLPRRLVGRALDSDGSELDRVTRLLNVYRPPAEVEYVLHRNSKGWLTMIELDWPRLGGASVGRFAVSVDGRAVEAPDAAQIWLPPLDPADYHVLEAVAEYTNGLVTVDRIGFGGEVLGGSSARVTPVVVEVDGESRDPSSVSLRARSGGVVDAPRVVALERGDAEITFVRDAAASRAIADLGSMRGVSAALAGARDAQTARLIHAVPLEEEEWIRLLDPSRSRAAEERLDLRRLQAPLVSDHEGKFGLFWHLKQVEEGGEATGAWISDGLALAGARLAATPRRRAAVLVLSSRSADSESRLRPADASRYLRALGIDLDVWYMGKAQKGPQQWGPPVAVRGMPELQDALDAVRRALDRQRVAWVEGVHLPGEIEVEGP